MTDSVQPILDRFRPVARNAQTLSSLIEQLGTPLGVVPFVGAGMSVDTGLPDWRRFLMDQAGEGSVAERVGDLLNQGKYEEAAQAIHDHRSAIQFQEAVERTFGQAALKTRTPQGAVLCLPRLASGPVITTNVDSVLETVFAHSGPPGRFAEVIEGVRIDLARKAFHRNDHVLLKLHGDASDRTHRVLTLQDYNEKYGVSQRLKALFEFTLTRRLLFLGCSLQMDRTVEVLRETAARYPDYVDHFAVLEQPRDANELTAREEMLGKLGIRPIWFPPGDFQSIELLLNALADLVSSVTTARASLTPASASASQISAFLGDIAQRYGYFPVFHSRRPVTLADQYIPIDVTLENSVRRETDSLSPYDPGTRMAWSHRPLFDEFEADRVAWDVVRQQYTRLVVLGDPGMGKTTLLRMEAARLAHEQRQKLETGEVTVDEIIVPLLLRLPELARFDSEIFDAVLVLIRRDYPNIPESVHLLLAEKLRGGKCVLLLDGLDETPRQLRNSLSAKISDRFGRNYPCPVICTSRVVGYVSGFLAGAREVEICPFREEQSRQFVRIWFRNTMQSEVQAADQSAQILRDLDANSQIAGLTRNPLILSLICSLYAEGKLAFPSRRTRIYAAALDCMLNEWRATREPQSPARVRSKLRLLEQLAWGFAERGKDVFTGEELYEALEDLNGRSAPPSGHLQDSAENLMREFTEEDGVIQKLSRSDDAYVFVHRTFQEYLAAGYLKRSIEKDRTAGLMLAKAHLWDVDWHETLCLAAGRLERPEALIEAIVAETDDAFSTLLLLAARAISECAENPANVFRHVIERLFELWRRFPDVPVIVTTVVASGRSHRRVVDLLKTVPSAKSASALAKIGTPPATEFLRQAVKQRADAYAAIALGRSGDRSVVSELVSVVTSGSYLSSEANQALVELGASEAADHLIGILLSDARDRRRVAETLVQLHAPRVTDALLPLLTTPPVDPFVLHVVASSRDGRVVEPAITLMCGEDDRKNGISESYHMQGLAIAALGEIGSEACVRALAEGLRHDSREVRQRAIAALARIGSETACEALIRALIHSDPDVRGQATAGLVNLAGEHAALALRGGAPVAAGAIQAQAVEALSDIGIADAVRSLSATLESVDIFDRWGTWLALGELGGTHDPRGNLEAEALYVRVPPARALADLRSEAATEALVHALGNNDGFVRAVAIHYLSRAPGAKAVDALINLMMSGDGWDFAEAAEGLARLGASRAAEPLFDLISKQAYLFRREPVRALERILTDSVARRVLALPTEQLLQPELFSLAHTAALRIYRSDRREL
jgi:HEAT repeat protein